MFREACLQKDIISPQASVGLSVFTVKLHNLSTKDNRDRFKGINTSGKFYEGVE